MTEMQKQPPTLKLGHVVLKMRDLDKAKAFYRDILGLKITEERGDFGVFFRFADYHHDIAIFKVDDDAAAPEHNQVGLSHLALVADSRRPSRPCTAGLWNTMCPSSGRWITG